VSFNKDGERYPTHVFEAALWRYGVKVTCSCGHTAIFEAAGLWGLFNRKQWDDYHGELRKRMRCTECLKEGRKQAPQRVEFVEGEEPTIKLPIPGDEDLKRALSRYRA